MQPNRNIDQVPEARKYKKGKAAVVRPRLSRPSYIKAAHSGKKEAVIKITSHGRGNQVKNMINYIGQTEKEDGIELEDQDGAVHKGKDAVLKIYKEWKEEFPKPNKALKRQPRDATHIVLSANAENNKINLKKVHMAARGVAAEQLRDRGYDYMIGLHQDGAKPHAHIICKTHNREQTGPKLRIGPQEIQEIREVFAQKLTELGLEHVATRRIDRPHTIDKVNRGLETIRKAETQFQRAMSRTSPSKNVLEYKKSVSKSICQLRESVKKDKNLPQTKRRELLGKIRKTERSLVKKEKHSNINKEIKATVMALGKDANRYSKQVNAITNPKPKKTIKQEKEKIQKFNKTIINNIQDAKKYIVESSLPMEQKKQAVKTLEAHEKNMKTTQIILEPNIATPENQVSKTLTVVNKYQTEIDGLTKKIKKEPDAIKRFKMKKEITNIENKIEKIFKKCKETINKLQVTQKVKVKTLEDLNKQQNLFLTKTPGREI